MSFREHPRDLGDEHRPETIRARISRPKGQSWLGDSVLGGVDGVITTFAVVAGSAGGHLPTHVVILLGLANLIADGFSMGVSNYLGTRSRQQEVERAREDESWQIERYPEGEKREIREIFAQKGFDEAALDRIIEVITRNREVWTDTMLQEELKLSEVSARPMRAAVATFIAFVVFGFIPLLPFMVTAFPADTLFLISTGLSGLAFIALGVWKGAMLKSSLFRSGVQTFVIGGIAAVLAYLVGSVLYSIFGVSPAQPA